MHEVRLTLRQLPIFSCEVRVDGEVFIPQLFPQRHRQEATAFLLLLFVLAVVALVLIMV